MALIQLAFGCNLRRFTQRLVSMESARKRKAFRFWAVAGLLATGVVTAVTAALVQIL